MYLQRKELPSWVCLLCMVVASVGMLYHFYKLCTLTEKAKYKRWVYLVHIWYVFPLIGYIGYKCYTCSDKECKPERMWFEALLLFTFAALGYHSFNAVKYGLTDLD